MARTRDYKAEYERRLALGRARFFSKQRARGHAGTRERPIPLGQEYQARKRRAIERGELTPADKAFLARQEQRAAGAEDWEYAKEFFINETPENREEIRREQATLHRRWVSRGKPWSRDRPDETFWVHVPRIGGGHAVLLWYH